MLTAKEYIRLKPNVLWIHNLDLLAHVLKADPKDTAYRTDEEPYWKAHTAFVEEIERAVPVDQFRKIEEGFNRQKTTVEIPAEQGALNVNRYLNNDPLCFDEPVKWFRPRLSRTIIFDYGKNQNESNGKDCQKRYEKIYKQVIEAEENGEPCRVIGVEGHSFSEIHASGADCLRIYLIIKDYDDPIFPAIWACVKTNRASWALGNVIADFLVGTGDYGNGKAVGFSIGNDIPADEDVQIIDSVKITR